MKDVMGDIRRWFDGSDSPVALATVIRTWGSAPRKVGAKMAVSTSGQISGSVSGGCVEGAVVEAAQQVLRDGRSQLLQFGVSDETAWDVGLACGGTIEIFVERLGEARFQLLESQLQNRAEGRLVTVVRGPEPLVGQNAASFANGPQVATLDDAAAAQAVAAAWQERASGTVNLTPEIELFVEVLTPPPTLIIVGGVHVAVSLVEMASILGYETIIVDPRRAFGSAERFPDVDQLIQAWPDAAFANLTLTPNTAVVLLTHDPKIDDPALKLALASDVFYVGALGSRKTHAKRLARLAESGLDDEQLRRIHAPIGLNIGAQDPQEIALSVMAEIVATRRAAGSESN